MVRRSCEITKAIIKTTKEGSRLKAGIFSINQTTGIVKTMDCIILPKFIKQSIAKIVK